MIRCPVAEGDVTTSLPCMALATAAPPKEPTAKSPAKTIMSFTKFDTKSTAHNHKRYFLVYTYVYRPKSCP
ncbi:hypothetical protein GCM10017044_04780 [Kordiimonas sediminis]|uniref:Uncharacterized protein n=1 Tax=Kordiimonas sediminis TaxID=1735581 RepID=A0A919AKZ7_9PROT|nr:hypothetical protein GCM10017044_04780 [Kordiimonas sediminis]